MLRWRAWHWYYAFLTLGCSVKLRKTSCRPKNRGRHCRITASLCVQESVTNEKHKPVEKISTCRKSRCWQERWNIMGGWEGPAEMREKEEKGPSRERKGVNQKPQRSAQRQWVVVSHPSFQGRWRKRHRWRHWSDFWLFAASIDLDTNGKKCSQTLHERRAFVRSST